MVKFLIDAYTYIMWLIVIPLLIKYKQKIVYYNIIIFSWARHTQFKMDDLK